MHRNHAHATGEDFGFHAPVGTRAIRAESRDGAACIRCTARDDIKRIRRRDDAIRGWIGVVPRISGRSETHEAVRGRDVHCLRRDRSHAIEIFRRVPIDVAKRTRRKISAISFDEFEAGDVVIFFDRNFVRVVLGLREDELRRVRASDRGAWQVGRERAENPRAMLVLFGVVTDIDSGVRVVRNEVPFGDHIEWILRRLKRLVDTMESRVEHADDHAFAVESAYVHRWHGDLRELIVHEAVVDRGDAALGKVFFVDDIHGRNATRRMQRAHGAYKRKRRDFVKLFACAFDADGIEPAAFGAHTYAGRANRIDTRSGDWDVAGVDQFAIGTELCATCECAFRERRVACTKRALRKSLRREFNPHDTRRRCSGNGGASRGRRRAEKRVKSERVHQKWHSASLTPIRYGKRKPAQSALTRRTARRHATRAKCSLHRRKLREINSYVSRAIVRPFE